LMVRDSFRRYAQEEPVRIRLIDASGDAARVTTRLLAEISDLLS
jgi:dTMP kinase